MNKVSLQDIFDAAWQHFIVEDYPPSVDKHPDSLTLDGCSYFGQNTRCAVGWALTEEQAKEADFIGGLDDLVEKKPDWFADDVLNLTNQQLQKFQYRLHDGLYNTETFGWGYSKEEMKQRYIEVVNDFNLIIPGGAT